ncbi:MAG: methyltransferase domain-containing protein [Chloroflexota bacterium]
MDCCSYDRQFNARHAEDDLREYRRKGPTGLTRALIEALVAGGVEGRTVLEIGGGVGAVHHELLGAGAATAVDVDASRAYVLAAREESERQGHADRVDYRVGDFVALADEVDPADVVALDRVICCYADMSSLVDRSAALAKGRYGLVYPRYTKLGRIAIALVNVGFRLSRSPFRSYLHRTADVDAILARHGLVRSLHRTTLIWQLAVYERLVV